MTMKQVRSLSGEHGRMQLWRRLAAIALYVALSACVSAAVDYTSGEAGAIDRLLTSMKRRLEIAPEVARDKWNRGAPVEDAKREAAIIEAALAQAAQRGIDPDRLKRFLRGQIEAGKAIQTALMAQWEKEHRGKFANAADLAGKTRPELDRLTAAMILEFGEVMPLLDRTGGNQWGLARAKTVTSDLAGFDRAWPIAVNSLAAAP
jgi:chorismate mutase-like protein